MVRIDLNRAGAAVSALGKQLREAQMKGCLAAAVRGVAYIQSSVIPATSPHPPVDRNNYSKAWSWIGIPNGAMIFNNSKPPFAPASVIEFGIKRGTSIFGGIPAIAEWAERKGIVTKEEAYGFALNVARKVYHRGRPGLFVMKRALPRIQMWHKDEMERFVRRVQFGGK